MNRKPVIIKKYENRRLYDTTNSRYINQDEVAQMLQSGYDVQVVDAATGEDLTRLVLTHWMFFGKWSSLPAGQHRKARLST